MPEYTMGDLRTGLTLDVAGKLLRDHFRDLLKINLYIFIPVMFCATLLSAYLDESSTVTGAIQNLINLRENPELAAPTAAESVLKMISLLINSLAGLANLLFITPVTAAASLYYLASRYLGRSISPREALRQGFKKYGHFLLCGVLYWLIQFAFWMVVIIIAGGTAFIASVASLFHPAFLLILVPAGIGVLAAFFYLSVRYALCFPAVMVEDAHDISALRRSSYLTRERIWRGIFLYLTVSLVCLLIVMGAALIPVIWLSTALTIFGTAVTQTFSLAVLLCYYFNCRSVHENFDVLLLTQQAFPATPESATPALPSDNGAYANREPLLEYKPAQEPSHTQTASLNARDSAGDSTAATGEDAHA